MTLWQDQTSRQNGSAGPTATNQPSSRRAARERERAAEQTGPQHPSGVFDFEGDDLRARYGDGGSYRVQHTGDIWSGIDQGDGRQQPPADQFVTGDLMSRVRSAMRHRPGTEDIEPTAVVRTVPQPPAPAGRGLLQNQPAQPTRASNGRAWFDEPSGQRVPDAFTADAEVTYSQLPPTQAMRALDRADLQAQAPMTAPIAVPRIDAAPVGNDGLHFSDPYAASRGQGAVPGGYAEPDPTAQVHAEPTGFESLIRRARSAQSEPDHLQQPAFDDDTFADDDPYGEQDAFEGSEFGRSLFSHDPFSESRQAAGAARPAAQLPVRQQGLFAEPAAPVSQPFTDPSAFLPQGEPTAIVPQHGSTGPADLPVQRPFTDPSRRQAAVAETARAAEQVEPAQRPFTDPAAYQLRAFPDPSPSGGQRQQLRSDRAPMPWEGDTGLLPAAHSRDVGSTGSPANMLITSNNRADLTQAVSGTGDILITGTHHLSRELSSTGATSDRYDSREVDRLYDTAHDEPAAGVTPIRASRAISTAAVGRQSSMNVRRSKASAVPTVLAVVAGVMAVGVLALIVGSWVLKLF